MSFLTSFDLFPVGFLNWKHASHVRPTHSHQHWRASIRTKRFHKNFTQGELHHFSPTPFSVDKPDKPVNSYCLGVNFPLRFLELRWCAYEMGCFFSREEGQLEILPVKVAYILFLTAIFWRLGSGGFDLNRFLDFQGEWMERKKRDFHDFTLHFLLLELLVGCTCFYLYIFLSFLSQLLNLFL